MKPLSLIRKLCPGGALLLVWPLLAFAQLPAPLEMDLDYSTFAYSDEDAMLEVYLAFGARSLPFVSDSTAFQAVVPLFMQLDRSSVGTTLLEDPPGPVWTDSIGLQFAVTDTSSLQSGQQFVHLIRTDIPPGEYELTVTVPRNLEKEQPELMLRRDVLVSDFTTQNQVYLSDITLASSISSSENRADVFYKNGLSIRPNPNLLYGLGLPVLFYYTEAYHLDQFLDTPSYSAYIYVADANNPQPLHDLEKRIERQVRTPDVLVGSFNIGSLPSGSYILKVILLDEDNRALVEQSQKFFVYNPNVISADPSPAVVDEQFEMSIFAGMSEEEVIDGLNHISVIAKDHERDQIKNMEDRTLEEKRQYLMSFWTRRDPDPNTPVNELRQEFYTRMQYARERYSSQFQEGWQTDRGRIILKYGIPTNVEPRPYARGMAPHEIWEYNNIPGEGQAIFIFADLSGFNEYELLHTNVTGERQNPNWESILRNRGR